MTDHPSLAQTTVHWCARDTSCACHPTVGATGLTAMSREALRVAGMALLQAAAGELSDHHQAATELEKIAACFEDDDALATWEADLVAKARMKADMLESTCARQTFVDAQLRQWIEQHLAPTQLPKAIGGWISEGWPDLSARGGVLSFYQAYCRALHRVLRREQTAIDRILEGAPVNSGTWRQWLIREGEPRGESHRRTSALAVLVTVLLLAAAATGAWTWWKSVTTRAFQSEAITSTPSPEAVPPLNLPPVAESLPGATPEPPKPTTPPPSSSPTPTRVAPSTPAADTKPEIKQLLETAERSIAAGKPADLAAKRAQTLLDLRLPANDADLGDLLERLGLYWEAREEWSMAIRVHQAAVKTYEKTPAENAAPQLQAVNRWASALRHNGRNTEAIQLYQRLLEAYQDTGLALRADAASVSHNLANALFASGRLREAHDFYAKALSLIADIPSDPAARQLAQPLQDDYAQCLRALGVSEAQIQSDKRRILSGQRGATPTPAPANGAAEPRTRRTPSR